MTDHEAQIRALSARREEVERQADAVKGELAEAVADAYRTGRYAACDIMQWAGIARRTFYRWTEGTTIMGGTTPNDPEHEDEREPQRYCPRCRRWYWPDQENHSGH